MAKILFQLSGSIACYKSCHVISQLVKEGHQVQTVATKDALRFVGTATLEGLTGKPVFSDIYQEGQQMDHIHLNRWSDLTVICPATANTINQMAAGIATNAIGTLFLAHDFKTPTVVVPAMNQAMWAHPTTQKSIGSLQEWGLQVMSPESGHQACGEQGPGRLPEPETILTKIHELLDQPKGGIK